MADFSPIAPVALLTVGLLAVILADLFARGKRPGVSAVIAGATLVAGGVYALLLEPSDDLVLGVLRADRFSLVLTAFCCFTGALTIWATTRGEAFRRPGGEFLSLVVAAVIGMCVLAMSQDLVCLYLAFETVSIPSYVLVGMRRSDLRANEASMKYVLFGAVSSAFMLYGLSMFIGMAGTTDLNAMSAALHNGMAGQPMFYVAVAMMLAGFAFKISAVPFHFWAPDVYAGAPAAVGGFLAVASKAAGFAALVRVVAAFVPTSVPDASSPATTFLPEGSFLLQAIAVIAILTMTFGNLAALRQREIKRLLAWSSIAHAGYILLAISIWSEASLAALVFYLIAYLFMNLAAFFIAGVVIREEGTGEISKFRGLGTRNIWLALGLTLVLFSLTGLPPFFGFAAKLQVFYAVFAKKYVWLGVIGLLNGAISLYYYARIIAVVFPFADSDEEAPVRRIRLAWADKALCALLVLPVVIFGLWWGPIWEWARSTVGALVGGGA